MTGGRVGLLVNRNLFRAGARDGLGERTVLGDLHHANTGWAVGALENALLGASVGTSIMSLGALDGTDVGSASVGMPLGELDGTDVGSASVGMPLGALDGTEVGMSVGIIDGMALGV